MSRQGAPERGHPFGIEATLALEVELRTKGGVQRRESHDDLVGSTACPSGREAQAEGTPA